MIQEKQQELEKVQLHLEKIVKSIPTKEELNLPLLEKEKQVKVIPKLIGKPEIIETETENFIVTPFQYKMMKEGLLGVETLKKQNEYLLKENNDLKSDEKYRKLEKEKMLYLGSYLDTKKELEKVQQENVELKVKYNSLETENKELQKKVINLTAELRLFYLVTKDYLKERIKDLKTFQNVFKGIFKAYKENVKVVEDYSSQKDFKSHLKGMYDRDRDFNVQENKIENDRGMER